MNQMLLERLQKKTRRNWRRSSMTASNGWILINKRTKTVMRRNKRKLKLFACQSFRSCINRVVECLLNNKEEECLKDFQEDQLKNNQLEDQLKNNLKKRKVQNSKTWMWIK